MFTIQIHTKSLHLSVSSLFVVCGGTNYFLIWNAERMLLYSLMVCLIVFLFFRHVRSKSCNFSETHFQTSFSYSKTANEMWGQPQILKKIDWFHFMSELWKMFDKCWRLLESKIKRFTFLSQANLWRAMTIWNSTENLDFFFKLNFDMIKKGSFDQEKVANHRLNESSESQWLCYK